MKMLSGLFLKILFLTLLSIPAYPQANLNENFNINLYGGLTIPAGKLTNEVRLGSSFGLGVEKIITKDLGIELKYQKNLFDVINPTTASNNQIISTIENLSVISKYTFFKGFTNISVKSGLGLFFFREGFSDTEQRLGIGLGLQTHTRINNYFDFIAGATYNNIFREGSNINYALTYGGLSLKW